MIWYFTCLLVAFTLALGAFFDSHYKNQKRRYENTISDKDIKYEILFKSYKRSQKELTQMEDNLTLASETLTRMRLEYERQIDKNMCIERYQ